jgi:DNA primase
VRKFDLEGIAASYDIVSVAERLGLNPRMTGRVPMCRCPIHDEKTPSMALFRQIKSKPRGGYKCYGCGAYGNVIDLVMVVLGCPLPEAVSWLTGQAIEPRREEPKRLLRDVTKAAQGYAKLIEQPQGEKARAYLESRGISERTRYMYGLGLSYEDASMFSARLTIPYVDRMFHLEDTPDVPVRNVKYRLLEPRGDEPKYLATPGATPELYLARDALTCLEFNATEEGDSNFKETFVVVEGEINALSIREADPHLPVVGIGGAQNFTRALFADFAGSRAVVITDGDTAGETGRAEIHALFSEWGIVGLDLRIPDGDANTALLDYGKEALYEMILVASQQTPRRRKI